MRIVPENKHDLAATKALNQVSDSLVKKHIPELLMWMKDWNWPVAGPICQRLGVLGMPLVEPIKEILRGDDEMWKYCVLRCLLPEVKEDVKDRLRLDLLRISNTPTLGEIEEELHIAARDLL